MQLLSAARLRERQVTEFVRDHEVEPGQVIRTTAMFAASGLRTFIVASGVWFMRVGYMALGLGTGAWGLGPGDRRRRHRPRHE